MTARALKPKRGSYRTNYQIAIRGCIPNVQIHSCGVGQKARPNTGLLVSPTPQENAIYALIGMLPYSRCLVMGGERISFKALVLL